MLRYALRFNLQCLRKTKCITSSSLKLKKLIKHSNYSFHKSNALLASQDPLSYDKISIDEQKSPFNSDNTAIPIIEKKQTDTDIIKEIEPIDERNIEFLKKNEENLHLNNLNDSDIKTNKKKYAVFVCGDTVNEPEYGDYGEMIKKLLSSNPNKDKYFEFKKYMVYKNEIPNKDEILNNNYDGIILSGSRFDAHDLSTKWIYNLHYLMKDILNDKHNSLKILGICFGAQLISNVLNGKSGRADIGWELGLRSVNIDIDAFKTIFPSYKHIYKMLSDTYGTDIKSMDDIDLPLCLPTLEVHRDQITKLPDNAILLASSSKCPIEMYAIENKILCVQGHPEFDNDYVKILTNSRYEAGIFDQNVKNNSYQSIDNGPKPAKNIWGWVLRNWLK